MAVAVALSTSSAPASRSGLKSDCSLTSTGLIPLTDMGAPALPRLPRRSLSRRAQPPVAAYLRKGLAASRNASGGSTGRSSCSRSACRTRPRSSPLSSEWSTATPRRTRDLTIVDGAQDGWDARAHEVRLRYWDLVDERLNEADVSANQVQAVWLKQSIAGEDRRFPQGCARRSRRTCGRSSAPCASATRTSASSISRAERTAAMRSRASTRSRRPMTAAMRSVASIQDRMAASSRGRGSAGARISGPTGSLGRSDGLVWSCDDVDEDGTHPSKTGVQKVVNLLTAFFKTDPTARRWFVAPLPPENPPKGLCTIAAGEGTRRNRRSRLRRPPTRSGLRRGGQRIVLVESNPEKVDARPPRRELHQGRRLGRPAAARRVRSDRDHSDYDALKEAEAILIALRRRSRRSESPTSRSSSAPSRTSRRACRRASSSSSSRRPIPARRASACCRCSSEAASGRRGLPPGVLSRAGRPGPRGLDDEEHAQDRGWDHTCLHRAGRRALQPRDRDRPSGLVARGRRADEAAREHLPLGQHRARQRARAALRPDEHRRLGGDRRGGDEAVRLHELPARPRARRPLHADRPLLPDVEGARVRLLHGVHRARRAR